MIHAGIDGCKEDLNEAGVGLPVIHPQKQYLVTDLQVQSGTP